jgi:chromosome segregation ATPase
MKACGQAAALLLTLLCNSSEALLRSAHRGGDAVKSRHATTAKGTGLDDVISLLASMLTGLHTQAGEDKTFWEQYQAWSDKAEVDKTDFKSEQTGLVMSNEALKSSNQQQVQKLTGDLAQLVTDIATTKSSIAELVQMRQGERQEFEGSLADLTKTINAVGKAVSILEGHYAADMASLEEIRSRVQMALSMNNMRLSTEEKSNAKTLASLLQGSQPDWLKVKGQEAYGSYKSQAGGKGVVGMLEDLRSQLEGQKQDLITKETESREQFEQTKATKEADLAQLKSTQTEKTQTKAQCEATIEECTAAIDQAKKDILDAEQYLTLLKEDRAKFSIEYRDRQATRSSETAATQAALDALQAVSAGAKGGVSFLQKSSVHALTVSEQQRLKSTFQNLITLGKELKNTALVQAASNLLNKGKGKGFFDADAMGPVKGLLSDLIGRLEAEASEETSQHEWCETEKTTSQTHMEEREKNIHALKATIESLTTEISTLKTEITFMESEVVRVEQETKDAITLRAEQKETFLQAKKDHEEVIGAIQQALSALLGHFGFIQKKTGHKIDLKAKHHQMPDGSSPFATYASAGGGAGSAVEMLEDLQSRYTEALTTLIQDEKTAIATHEQLLKTNKKFVLDTEASIASKTAERRAAINDLGEDKAELKTNLLELHEVAKYLKDLRPSCDDIRSTYEERKKRREAEIGALKEALAILSNPEA